MQQDLSKFPMLPENWNEDQYLKTAANIIFIFIGLTLFSYLLNH